MPVPVSVTHAQRAGLQSSTHTELPTAGPFATLGSRSSGNERKSEDERIEEAIRPGNEAHCAVAEGNVPAIRTNHLSFWYCDIDGRQIANRPAVVQDMSIEIPRGSSVLLIGPNGAGKTTLLKVLGGKHMVNAGAVNVLGLPPFHATHLTSSGSLAYVGGNWERDIAFAGYSIPLAGDIPARQMLNSMPDTDPKRLEKLIDVLDIDPEWRMHLVSDGQRRRVQIAMGLLKPFDVLLLDEITVDLDVLGRSDLMKFLKEECQERNATILYATHIFDGLESWPSHVMYVASGSLKLFEKAENIPQLKQGDLLGLVEGWLRKEKEEKEAREGPVSVVYHGDRGSGAQAQAEWNNGWAAGRLTSSMQLSSNAVMRN